jgi:hypothetical protein
MLEIGPNLKEAIEVLVAGAAIIVFLIGLALS